MQGHPVRYYDGTTSPPETETYKMVVMVANACGLMPMDGQGSSSACVELDFDGHRFRTAVKEKNLNPAWNEQFCFDYAYNPSKKKKPSLQACVFHARKSKYNFGDFLGRVKIHCHSIPHYSDDLTYHYHKLKKHYSLSRVSGELCLKVYITKVLPNIASKDPLPDKDRMIISIPALEDRRPSRRDVRSIPEEDPYPRRQNVTFVQDEEQSSRPRDIPLVQEGDWSSRPRDIPFGHLEKITNNFSDERILGHGGFGVVYKGVLQNGEMIAVKKMISSLRPGLQKQFEKDVYHLMMLNHPNIVRFVGYCYETQYKCLEYNGKYVFAEMAERLLCLEYLPKGSLDKYLSDESSGLDWSTRYNIIEGICHGLCHLHEKLDNPIIHLDLKPANILLDDGMVPKLTDFGLSRLLDQQQTICTSSHDGTLGYMPPELFHGGTVTPKSDIFSLGVIIVEIVTGDKPDITGKPSDEIIELALKKWRNVLQRSPRHESLERDCEQIKRCIQVGLMCVNHDRKRRPSIMKVIDMLQGSEGIDSDISNEAT